MIDAILQPGPLILAALVVFAVIKCAAALVIRSHRRRMLTKVRSLIAEPDLTREDKAWLRDEIETSKGKMLLAVSPLAPIAIFGAAMVGAYEGWRAREGGGRLFDFDSEVERIDRDTDRIHAKAVKLREGFDPRSGKYWNDPRREEIFDDSFVVEVWSSPLAALWIIAWLILASPLLLVGYAVSGTIRPFIENLWQPFREPLASALVRATK